MPKLLLIHDENEEREQIRQALLSDRHSVEVAECSKDAIWKNIENYDLVVIKYALEGLDGLHICKHYRSRCEGTPLLMLSKREAPNFKIQVLDSGVDDVLARPFDIGELRARVRALLRRSRDVKGNRLTFDSFSYDTRTHILLHAGQEVPLRQKEQELLEFFLRHPNSYFSAVAILERVWRHSSRGSVESVRTSIKTLRRKLEPTNKELVILSNRRGYRLNPKISVSTVIDQNGLTTSIVC